MFAWNISERASFTEMERNQTPRPFQRASRRKPLQQIEYIAISRRSFRASSAPDFQRASSSDHRYIQNLYAKAGALDRRQSRSNKVALIQTRTPR